MRLPETLKALSLVALAIALEAGFLLHASLPPAEVLRAAHESAKAAQTTIAEAPAAPEGLAFAR